MNYKQRIYINKNANKYGMRIKTIIKERFFKKLKETKLSGQSKRRIRDNYNGICISRFKKANLQLIENMRNLIMKKKLKDKSYKLKKLFSVKYLLLVVKISRKCNKDILSKKLKIFNAMKDSFNMGKDLNKYLAEAEVSII